MCCDFVTLEVIHGMGARADQAHVSFEHVPELGQFVEAVVAEEVADAGDARIIRDFEDWPLAFVVRAQFFAEVISASEHSAELVADETAAPPAVAQAAIEDRTRRTEFDQACEHDKQR